MGCRGIPGGVLGCCRVLGQRGECVGGCSWCILNQRSSSNTGDLCQEPGPTEEPPPSVPASAGSRDTALGHGPVSLEVRPPVVQTAEPRTHPEVSHRPRRAPTGQNTGWWVCYQPEHPGAGAETTGRRHARWLRHCLALRTRRNLALARLRALRDRTGSATAGMHLGPGAGRDQIRGWAGGAPHSPCPASGFTAATDSFQVPTLWERSPPSPASPSQPYILLHMPIWSRPALWNVKKYVFLGWDPHAGTHQHWPRWRLWRNGASLGLVKRNQINLQLDLVPFNQLQRRMRYGTRCALAAPAWRGCRRVGWMRPALRGLGVRSGCRERGKKRFAKWDFWLVFEVARWRGGSQRGCTSAAGRWKLRCPDCPCCP